MKFYRDGVWATREMYADFLAASDLKHRHAFWGKIFDTNSYEMAKASLPGLTGVVPLDEIYSCRCFTLRA